MKRSADVLFVSFARAAESVWRVDFGQIGQTKAAIPLYISKGTIMGVNLLPLGNVIIFIMSTGVQLANFGCGAMCKTLFLGPKKFFSQIFSMSAT